MAANINSATPSSARLAAYTSASAYAAIPLPPELAPTDNSFWDGFTDDEILAMPAHVAVHLMRTAAQNGAQVISPRQVPSTTIVDRVAQNSNATFIHVAGSDASVTARWPVPPGAVPPDLEDLEGEPVRKHGDPLASRTPATTRPLVAGMDRIASPIQRAWIKARANCDFMSQEEVGGDADALADAYEKMFGAPAGSLLADPGLTVTGRIDFREHAIVVDNKMARQLAPIQARRVLTVAVGPSDAAAFGVNRGFDWTCARVVAETKFRLTVSNEGYTLTDVACSPDAPVGFALTAHMARPGNVMVYHPTAACAWSYDPATFAILPLRAANMARRSLNSLVAAELALGATFASPVAAAAAHRAAVAWVATVVNTTATAAKGNASDALNTFRSVMTSPTFSTRTVSKTGGKALRAELYSAINSAPLPIMCKMARALTVVKESIQAFYPDMRLDKNAVESLAHRMATIDSHINIHMLQTAAYRGENADNWFSAMSKQIPVAYRPRVLGTKGWAVIAVHNMLNPPDNKWRNLLKAIRSKTIDSMGATVDMATDTGVIGAVGEQRADTVLFRAQRAIASIRTMYGSNYDGAALGAAVVARMADARSMTTVAKAARTSAACWTFRQALVRTFKVRLSSTERAGANVFAALPVDADVAGTALWVTMSADMKKAYTSWAQKLTALGIAGVPPVRLPNYARSTVLTALLEVHPITNVTDDLVLANRAAVAALKWMNMATVPATLSTALTRSMVLAQDDCTAAIAAAMRDVRTATDAANARQAAAAAAASTARVVTAAAAAASRAAADAASAAFFAQRAARAGDMPRNGWYWLAKVDPDDAMYISDVRDEMVNFDAFIAAEYVSVVDFLEAFDAAERQAAMLANSNTDALGT